MITYAVLSGIALWLNRNNAKMLALTLVVTAGIFVPIPKDDNYPQGFYLLCMLVETIVMLAALNINTTVSAPLVFFSFMLIVNHLSGLYVGPQPGFGPYRLIVPIFEYGELLACGVCSNIVIDRIRKML